MSIMLLDEHMEMEYFHVHSFLFWKVGFFTYPSIKTYFLFPSWFKGANNSCILAIFPSIISCLFIIYICTDQAFCDISRSCSVSWWTLSLNDLFSWAIHCWLPWAGLALRDHSKLVSIISSTFIYFKSTDVWSRCDAPPDNLDDTNAHLQTHEKTDLLLEIFSAGIIWDEYGLQSDVVVS